MKLDVAAAEARAARQDRRAARHERDRRPPTASCASPSTAMSYAVKGVTTERGLDAGDFALVAYGGAGPLHAVAVAREIGIRNVIIPRAPGVFSAFGMLFSDLRYDYVRTWSDAARRRAVRRDRGGLTGSWRSRAAPPSPRPRSSRTRSRSSAPLDMRYVGQEHAVTVDLPMRRVREAGPHGDQAAFRRRCTCMRYGTSAPARARRDRQPAHDRHRRDAQAAAGEDQARRGRAAEARPSPASARSIRSAAGFVADADLSRARRCSPATDRGPGADRGARLDHGADAGRPADGRCLRQSRSSRSGAKCMAKTAQAISKKSHQTSQGRSGRSPRSCATASSP